MTVDVDGWSSLLGFYSVPHSPSEVDMRVNVDEGIFRLLELFRKHEIAATFFVTGEMAQRHRVALKTIRHDGHEIACHGLSHRKNECLLAKDKQRQTIEQATRILEKEAGCRPKGFRAPCLRSNETTLEILEEFGYVYDSSIVPTFVPRYYGCLTSPLRPYHPSSSLITKEGSSELLEIPISVNPIVRIPLGAAWMRNLGSLWVKLGIKMNFDLRNLTVFYVHPRDVMHLPKTKGVPWHLYRNTGDPALKMLKKIIEYVKRHGTFIRLIELAQTIAREELNR